MAQVDQEPALVIDEADVDSCFMLCLKDLDLDLIMHFHDLRSVICDWRLDYSRN